MLIIPAIDIKDGCVVRFTQGHLDKKIYSQDPVKTAKHWVKQGAGMLHVVDLDGALSGTPKNFPIVQELLRQIDIPVEFGGGLRDMRTIKALIRAGIFRVVLGTKAIQDETFLKKCFENFKQQVIVSLDIRNDMLLTSGWQESQREKDAFGFMQQLWRIGFREIIYTDVSKDGTLKGPNIKDLKKLLKAGKMKIIASGGISCLEDIRRLKLMEKQGVAGIIIGKALYEGKFTLAQALKIK